MINDVKRTMAIQKDILGHFEALDGLLSYLRNADGLHDFERDTVVSVQDIVRSINDLIYSLGFIVEVKEDLNLYEEEK